MNKKETLLIDTIAVLYLIKGDENLLELLDQQPVAINFITETELLSWPQMTRELNKVIQSLISNVQYVDYNTKIKLTAITLRQKYKLKLADAFIGATAIKYNLPLVTADKHFQQVEELRLIKITPSI